MTRMKISSKVRTTLLAMVLLPVAGLAQTFPLSPNSWDNPDFVDRFLGSYGVRTDIEPKISESEAALFNELMAQVQNNQMPQAIAQLKAFLDANTGAEEPPSAALPFTLANMLLQEGQVEDAIRYYVMSIKQFPNFLRAQKNLGLAYLQNQNYEEAIKLIVKSIELGEGAGDTYGLLGYCYLNLGQYGPALEAYRQATLLNPENKEWHVGKAETLMRTEQYKEAIATFEYLIGLDDSNDAYYTSLANAYIALGEPLVAANYLEILFRTSKPGTAVLNLLGDIYLNELMPSLALRPYMQAFNAEGTIDEARILRTSKALLQRGYYDEADTYIDGAEAYFKAKGTYDSSRSAFLNLRAELALGMGQNAEAAGILEQVIEVEPTNGNALLLLGNYYFSIGEYEEAEFYYDRASDISGVAREALIQSARLHVQNKDYQQAIDRLRRAQGIEYKQNVQDFLEAVESVYDRVR